MVIGIISGCAALIAAVTGLVVAVGRARRRREAETKKVHPCKCKP